MIRAVTIFVLCIHLLAREAGAESQCVYQDSKGMIRSSQDIEHVPSQYRGKADCFSKSPKMETLARPQEIKLEGSQRKEIIPSPIGEISLRWPRRVEMLFGRNPLRASVEASRAVARALASGGFPSDIVGLNIPWNVIFMDEALPEKQIPQFLVDNCHPGWMVPIADIYIVGQRVANGCSSAVKVSKSVADSELTQVLIHEMGHAVEYQIGQGRLPVDRMRSEGFACWFEQFASEFSPLVPKGSAKGRYMNLARISLQQHPDQFQFSGSAQDYARAATYFHAVVAKRGVRGLMDVYEVMRKDNLPLVDSILKTTRWSKAKLNEEIKKVVG